MLVLVLLPTTPLLLLLLTVPLLGLPLLLVVVLLLLLMLLLGSMLLFPAVLRFSSAAPSCRLPLLLSFRLLPPWLLSATPIEGAHCSCCDGPPNSTTFSNIKGPLLLLLLPSVFVAAAALRLPDNPSLDSSRFCCCCGCRCWSITCAPAFCFAFLPNGSQAATTLLPLVTPLLPSFHKQLTSRSPHPSLPSCSRTRDRALITFPTSLGSLVLRICAYLKPRSNPSTFHAKALLESGPGP